MTVHTSLLMTEQISVLMTVQTSVLMTVHTSVLMTVHTSVLMTVHTSLLMTEQISVLMTVQTSVLMTVHTSVLMTVHTSVLMTVQTSVLMTVHTSILMTVQTSVLLLLAPNDTGYKRWSCHNRLKPLCKLCRTSPPSAMGVRFTVFWACRPCGPAGWLELLLTKAGDVVTNPGPTSLNKKVWICDICHKQIHVRKQISIRCNRIEHWVHLRCAGIRL